MSLPQRLEAYDDCIEIFDAALADPSGTRVCYATFSEASLFMMRMHQARSLLRDLNARIYPSDDPRCGTTDYDKVMVRKPRQDADGEWWVYIERPSSRVLAIQPLSTIKDSTDAA